MPGEEPVKPGMEFPACRYGQVAILHDPADALADGVRHFFGRQLGDPAAPWDGWTLVSPDDTIGKRSRKHRRTLQAIFAEPVRANINWADIEAMLVAHGAEVTEGEESRVRIALNGIRAVFHRPHPQKETDKGAVRSMRRFLTEAGVTP